MFPKGGFQKPIGPMPVLWGVPIMYGTGLFVWETGIYAWLVGVGLPNEAHRSDGVNDSIHCNYLDYGYVLFTLM